MNEALVNILDGNVFVVSNERGDIDASPGSPTGLFAFDTRFLSTWVLTVNDQRLTALSVDDVQYFQSRFFLVPGETTQYVDAKLSVIRERTMCGGVIEHLTIFNHDERPVDITVRIDAGADFADIFSVKDVLTRHLGRVLSRVDEHVLRLRYERETFGRETVISAPDATHVDEHGMTFAVRIEPGARWMTEVRVQTILLGKDDQDVRRRFIGYGRDIREMRSGLETWLAEAPRLSTDSDALALTYRRSLVDLAALRFSSMAFPTDQLPAAGLPWFMTVFGRDSILTSIQALPFAPELGRTTLRSLATLQGSALDDFRDEDPGKILHEFRFGETAAFEEEPHTPYYGAADTTPLFVVLLDEYERWTGDIELVRNMERTARFALNWIDQYGDLMGDGYVWYERRNLTTGLENQCWKDSWDSISHRDGRLPPLPRATCELQGYAYDAKLRAARLARLAWNDPAYAQELEASAADLRERFNRDFWVEDGEYYALARDPEGGQVNALSSNIGHLLWSGIVDESRAGKLARHLLGPRLFSGWGIRTLAVGERRYNPIGYHVGTVWPFDNSFIALGLARYGFTDEAARIAEAMIDAAEFFRGRLPEAFAGYDRSLTRFPVPYPTGCSPQAWSTGAILLFLRAILGLEPNGDELKAEPALGQVANRIELHGILGRWGRADASAGRPPDYRAGKRLRDQYGGRPSAESTTDILA
jgi:glycogen debranching enzyme